MVKTLQIVVVGQRLWARSSCGGGRGADTPPRLPAIWADAQPVEDAEFVVVGA